MPRPQQPLTRRGATLIEFGCFGTMIVLVVVCAMVGWNVGRYLGLTLGTAAGLAVPLLFFGYLELQERRYRKAHPRKPPPHTQDNVQ
jgi:hypothetical protein